MMMTLFSSMLLFGVLALTLIAFPPKGSMNIIYHEVKPMGPLWVFEENSKRYLSFVPPGRETQTCLDLNNPDRVVYGYQQVILGCTLTLPEPKSICIVGLGGGALAKALHQLYPSARIDNIELNPDVLQCAEQFFQFKQNENVRVVIANGIDYFKNLPSDLYYDIIIMDAFDSLYIPPEFLTVPFVKSVYDHLSDQGAVFVNTFKRSTFYEREMRLYHHVFGSLYQPEMPLTWDGNRVLMAIKDKFVSYKETKRAAYRLQAVYEKMEMNIDRVLGCIVRLEPLPLVYSADWS